MSLRLTDAATGREIPGLIRVSGSDGRPLQLEGLVNRGVKLRGNHPAKEWFVVPVPVVLSLPQATVRIEAFSGLETEQTVVAPDLKGRNRHELTIALRRFHEPAGAGWRSGNTHLHISGMAREQADEYLRTVPRGDGLELLFVSYAARPGADVEYISNEYTRADLETLSSPGLVLGHGEEHRHNFGRGGPGYGHVLLLNLPGLVHPVSIGPGITGEGPDYPPLRRGLDRARGLGATIVWCHNAFGFEHAPNWLTGRLHAHNIFDGGTLGSYAYTFYRLLNLGFKVPFSTGTDWFLYDFSRVYVRLAGAPLNVDSWLRGLAAGRTFITNGPLLELQAGEHEIGDTISLRGPARFRVRARVRGRSPFQYLELVHNGRRIARAPSRPVDGHFVAELEQVLAVDSSGWIAARVSGGALDTDGLMALPPGIPRTFRPADIAGRNELGQTLFAHTSPIYFEVAGRPLFDPAAARALIESMEHNLRTIEAKARFDDGKQRIEVIRLYREAIEQVRSRLGR